ncbi:hypothetical protein EVAR_32601_1 [Eumeta japonica]|uniref:Craniofacial development protein 2 n=1 Tax=Eumeta variegata TaxID=151549 RepID=A0A4C1WFY1_EUMVA|nr:hypothetical protein EVAR_32601_1 [Eumeta japonica]
MIKGKVVVMGDFNAKVGYTETDYYPVMGKHGHGVRNKRDPFRHVASHRGAGLSARKMPDKHKSGASAVHPDRGVVMGQHTERITDEGLLTGTRLCCGARGRRPRRRPSRR